MSKLVEKFIIELSASNIDNISDLQKFQRRFAKKSLGQFIATDKLSEFYQKMIADGTIARSERLDSLLRLKSTRSQSGIVVISVLTKPFPCPGKCIYCPSERNVPKSYLSNEPAVMRAIMCKYDPFLQVSLRLKALKAVGHTTDKINIRIIGGTWSYYPRGYQTWFIKRMFEAANDNLTIPAKAVIQKNKLLDFGSQVPARNSTILERLQEINESAKHRIVEISVETRQDYINKNELKRLRKLGVTKVELGVQSLYDKVLRLNKRGNLDMDTILATKLLKDAGFKVSYQMMLNLPGSNQQMDIGMFQELFANPLYMPDHLKIYPMALLRNTGAYQLYKDGKFKPYSSAQLSRVLTIIKASVPEFCRIERVIRDIPSGEIVEGGAKVSNLRQDVLAIMKKDGIFCRCIRCREIKSNFKTGQKTILVRRDYESSGGKEIFLSIETEDGQKLISFLRLRISKNSDNIYPCLKDAALIREIHTYGEQVEVGMTKINAPQHRGFGKSLMLEAEKIAKEESKVVKMAVISGVGVRGFFRKLGYHLEQTYMTKKL
ncbi:MAG: tRNA uridine(34) 5-carboxymethylaminomethyl modification radical SAM/GNAT enzyme Elp3 [Patescibacteria group bacterium]